MRILLCACCCVVSLGFGRVIDAQRYHLGIAGQPEWEEFAGAAPHGPQLDLTFTAEANAGEVTLLIRQRNVKTTWNVLLNGQRIGTLETLNQPLVRALPVAAGALRPGPNRLTIQRAPSRGLDDVVVEGIVLEAQPRAEVLGAATLAVSVTDAGKGVGVPCRITIVDEREALAPVHPAAGQSLAVRTGVVYSGDGKARLGVAPGDYVVYASRGFEYSVARQQVSVAAGETKPLALQIRREVPTPGLVACDTHIHTLTYSKHGDATIDERMFTIAGEGIELAVATDHNHHADYTEAAARTRTSGHFRGLVGNEVTTKAGHFNAFPVAAGSALPNAQLTDWAALLHNIRSVTGAKVITLNHPRDVHSTFMPFGPDNFDAGTGALRAGEKVEIDAIEVVTSAAMQSDVMQLFRDWFALLNYGYRVSGIGASDTHHVSEFILGQARTYAPVARDAEPAAIDVNEVCESYRQGRVLVSFGLLTTMEVDAAFRAGDIATGIGGELRVDVRVVGPSWVTADRVELFANGIKVREKAIEPSPRIEKAQIAWTLPRPKHDVHLVAVATGPGVIGPFWEVPRPYQPAEKAFTPRLLGATNPIWVDGDRDGAFTPARGYARRLVERAGGDATKVAEALRGFDVAVARQAEDLMARRAK